MPCINKMRTPMIVAVTGASGQIGYNLIFKIAAGQMLGPDQPVILKLIELPQAIDSLKGVCMEIQDCAFPLLHGMSVHTDPNEGFLGAHYALLVGAMPRGPGMERKDLLSANAKIFSVQGKAINDMANPDVRVVVVGNPANTNALIASRNAPDLSPAQFTAMSRLDHNRAAALLASKCGANPSLVKNLAIWGNHSATQFPDIHDTTIYGKAALEIVDEKWYKEEFIKTVAQRGAEIIKARGKSSAASAASAAIDHIRDWALGSNGEWVSMGIISDGSYGVAKGIVFSFPVVCKHGQYEIVQGLDINDFQKEKIKITEKELLEERTAIADELPKETEESHENLSVNTFSNKTDYTITPMSGDIVLRADRITY